MKVRIDARCSRINLQLVPPSGRSVNGNDANSLLTRRLGGTIQLLELARSSVLNLRFSPLRTPSAKLLATMANAGLLDKEVTRAEIAWQFNKIAYDLQRCFSELTDSALKAVLILHGADLLDHESISSKISPYLNSIFDHLSNLGDRAIAAKVIWVLVKTGLMDRESAKERVMKELDWLVYGLNNKALSVRESSKNAILKLIDADLIDRESIDSKKILEGLNEYFLHLGAPHDIEIDLSILYEHDLIKKISISEEMLQNLIWGLRHERAPEAGIILFTAAQKNIIDKNKLFNMLLDELFNSGDEQTAALIRTLADNNIFDLGETRNKIKDRLNALISSRSEKSFLIKLIWELLKAELIGEEFIMSAAIMDLDWLPQSWLSYGRDYAETIHALANIAKQLIEKGFYDKETIKAKISFDALVQKIFDDKYFFLGLGLVRAIKVIVETELADADLIKEKILAVLRNQTREVFSSQFNFEPFLILMEAGLVDWQIMRERILTDLPPDLIDNLSDIKGNFRDSFEMIKAMIRAGLVDSATADALLGRLIDISKGISKGPLLKRKRIDSYAHAMQAICALIGTGSIALCRNEEVRSLYQRRSVRSDRARKELVRRAYYRLKGAKEDESLRRHLSARGNMVHFYSEKNGGRKLPAEIADLPESSAPIGLPMVHYGIVSVHSDAEAAPALSRRTLVRKFYQGRHRLPLELNVPATFGGENLHTLVDVDTSRIYFVGGPERLSQLQEPAIPIKQIEESGTINGVPIKMIEKRMRPNEASFVGFLGKEEKLLDRMRKDHQTVGSLGITHWDLAAHISNLFTLTDLSREGLDDHHMWKRIVYLGEILHARHALTFGYQGSPFYNQEGNGADSLNHGWTDHLDVFNPRNNLMVTVGGNNKAGVPVFIRQLGFYEGGGTTNPYRVDPDILHAILYGRPASPELRAKSFKQKDQELFPSAEKEIDIINQKEQGQPVDKRAADEFARKIARLDTIILEKLAYWGSRRSMEYIFLAEKFGIGYTAGAFSSIIYECSIYGLNLYQQVQCIRNELLKRAK